MKHFWAFAPVLGPLLWVSTFVHAGTLSKESGEPGFYRLRGSHTEVRFDKQNGNIVGLKNLKTGSELITETRLAESFRLFVPLPEKRGNHVYGKDQKLSRFEKENGSCTLTWNQVETDEGKLDIDVVLKVTLDDRNQELSFSIDVDNRSQYVIEEVRYPVLAGINGIRDRSETKVILGNGWRAGTIKKAENLFTRFPAGANYSMRYPFLLFQYPDGLSMQWTDFYNPKAGEGVYIGSHDESCQLTAFYFELHPFVINRNKEFRWPTPKDVNEPIGLLFSIIKLPFIESGQRWVSAPVVVKFHEGDWHRGAERYRQWTDTWMTIPEKPEWVMDGLSWQTTFIGFPDRITRYRFKDLPAMARSAAEGGINCILLEGFHRGGQDVNYPDYSPDPWLGGSEGFRQGVEGALKQGVYVSLFLNTHVADKTIDWYKRELHQYVARDKWGEGKEMGWGFNSFIDVAARQAHRPLTLMCPMSKEWQDITIREVEKLAKLGAKGVQMDKLNFTSTLCYDPKHGHKVPQALAIGMLELLKRLKTTLRSFDPEFSLSGENAWDATLQYLDIGYTRTSDWDDKPILKYTFPEYLVTTCIDEADYNLVNNCLRWGYVINFEIDNLRGTMENASREMVDYSRWALQLRRDLSDYLLYGRFMDEQGVKIESEDESIKYGVHINRKNEKRAIVILNVSEKEKTVRCEVPSHPAGKYSLYRPFQQPSEVTLPGRVAIAPERVVVLIEK